MYVGRVDERKHFLLYRRGLHSFPCLRHSTIIIRATRIMQERRDECWSANKYILIRESNVCVCRELVGNDKKVCGNKKPGGGGKFVSFRRRF